MGTDGNDGDASIGYEQTVGTRSVPSAGGAFRGGATQGVQFARFGQGWDMVSTYGQGADGGRYTVEAGDTLSGIATRLWGDASLWYKLAQANGLSADSNLTQGQTLTIPAGVIRSANNADSLRPYDPSEIQGNTSPTTPKPQAAPKKNKCGVFGQILLVAIAVAVTIASHGAAAHIAGSILGLSGGAATVATGAIAAVAGSLASQTVGVATGIQHGFSWKNVAMAAIGGGIGGALQNVNAFGTQTGLAQFGSDVVRGALGNALTQGVGVVTGLQSRFDFAGVAVAGIAGGVGGRVSARFGSAAGGIVARTTFSTAGAIAGAAVRSLVEGTDFGDNVLAALPDAIGQAIGTYSGGEWVGSGEGSALVHELDHAWQSVDEAGRSMVGPHESTMLDAALVRAFPDSAAVTADIPDPTGGDPYAGVMTLAEAQAFNEQQAAAGINGGAGGGMPRAEHVYTPSLYLTHAELNASKEAYYADKLREGVYSNSEAIETSIRYNEAILQKADADLQQFDRQVAYGIGGVTLGAALSALVAPIVAFTGIEGVGGLGLTLTGEGLAYAGGNAPIRSAWDDGNTLATFGEDTLTGAAFGAALRLSSRVGSTIVNRLLSPAAERGGVSVASGFGNSAPASIVRTIQPGERVAEIVNEGKSLTYITGNEHAVVTLANGERALVSGGPGGIDFAEGSVSRIFGHTHPTPAPPSAADFQATLQLGQSRQYVFHGGQVTVVRPPK